MLERALFEVKHVVVGQDAMVERMMVGLLARGHVLLEGVPGVAKTLAVRTLATVVGGDFVRLQFTPDLMPSDIVGTRVWRPSTETLRRRTRTGVRQPGARRRDQPRPAKVQSALLEAMAEQQVSIGGQTHGCPTPFIVLATQNPIENDGVYALPEAQRDRFLLKVDVDHADELGELTIVQRMSADRPRAQQILTVADISGCRPRPTRSSSTTRSPMYAVQLVMATRHPHRYGLHTLDGVLEYGVSARGSLGLVAAARALALLRGRDYVLPGDIADVASDVLAHRLVLTFDAVADGVDPRTAVEAVLAAVPQPRIASSEDPSAVAAGGDMRTPQPHRPPPRPLPPRTRRRRERPAARLRRLELTVRRRARRPAARRPPGPSPRHGQRPRGTRALPARARRPPDRLERHRPRRRTYVWLTRAEHALETWVLVDRSPSMAFGTTDRRRPRSPPGRRRRSACSPPARVTGWDSASSAPSGSAGPRPAPVAPPPAVCSAPIRARGTGPKTDLAAALGGSPPGAPPRAAGRHRTCSTRRRPRRGARGSPPCAG